MSTWLTAWRNREDHEPIGPVMELLVLAGADAGSQFTIEGNEVLVGRGQPASGQTDVIRLDDKSISRRQAWIRRDSTGTSIEHIPTSGNPTLVNGAEISRARLSVGDRIEMGRVAIDVRARIGMNLSDLTQIMEGAARESTITGAPLDERTDVGESGASPVRTAPPISSSVARVKDVTLSTLGLVEDLTLSTLGLVEDVTLSTLGLVEDVTEVRPVEVELGELRVSRGPDGLAGACFPIGMGTTRIGRGDDVDVQVQELGVSRLHAQIEIAGRSLELIHKSGTNQTFVNGFPILDRVVLEDGDEIQLADRVALTIHFAATARPVEKNAHSTLGLSARMEHKIDLDREIEEFNVVGSFLDVDVVESRLMKGASEKAEHIIVSFDRFRSYVSEICEEFDGQVLNSNGDELMCFFESAGSALLAGSAILERLSAFNRDSNMLSKDFRFRLGVHTGTSLVDLSAGIAYSDVLDTAGHIQKQADTNTMLISEPTLESVPKGLPVTPVGAVASCGGPLYLVNRSLTADDVA